MSEVKFKAYTFGGWEIKPKGISVEDYYWADVFDIDSRLALEDFWEMVESVVELDGCEDFIFQASFVDKPGRYMYFDEIDKYVSEDELFAWRYRLDGFKIRKKGRTDD